MSAPRIDLDFGPRPRRASPLGIGLLVAGAAVAGVASLRVADALALQSDARQGLERVESAARRGSERAPVRRAAPDPRLAAQVQAGRQVAQALQSPWAGLLDAIEVRPSADVALLAVEPSAARRVVRITAEARSPKAMLEHIAMLQRDAHLRDVTLVSHQRQDQAPGTPWRYQLQASW